MSNKNDIIFFVITSVNPYKNDLIRSLALPSGLYDRVRWRETWVQKELIPINSQLIGKRGLLLLRNPENLFVYPIRWVEIKSTEEISDIFYYGLELKELCDYSDKLQVSNENIRLFNEELKLHHANESFNTDPNNNKCVFTSSIKLEKFANNSQTELVRWGNIVKVISTFSNLRGNEFLKLVEMKTFDDKRVEIKNGQFQLTSRVYYKMIVFQLVPNPTVDPPEPHDIEITAPSDHLKILKSKQIAVGKYDIINFVLQTSNLKEDEPSYVELISKAKNSDLPLVTTLPVYISVKITKWTILRIIVALLSLYVIIFTPTLGGIPKGVLNNLAIVVFVLAVSDKVDFGTQLMNRFKVS